MSDLEPRSVDVDREQGVTITWSEGGVATFDLVELRVNCPCAECRERRAAGEAIWPRPGVPEPLALLDANLVGAYGMAFQWNDGHHTGIYTWETLHRWSEGQKS
ncbi:MAG TPA: DUF971 domain-containing protein [Acidimicrobiales bacterium]